MTNLLTAMNEALRRRRNTNSTVRELHRLTDLELKDIGIHRGDIDAVARGILDIHRTVRDVNGNLRGDN
tara:strand:+ start:399 stop:605 length:207 start_codon:yes stop_codon:yes gene_type:complete